MTNSSKLLYLNRKKLVIKDIDYILESKGKEQYSKSRKNNIFHTFNFIFGTGRNRRQKLAQRKIPIDFLYATENSNRELDEIDEHIETILVSANNDKNILEECENYIQHKYKVHLARIQPLVSILQLIIFVIIISYLICLLVLFSDVDIKTININNLKTIISLLSSVIAVVTISVTITNILVPIFKPFVENSHANSTSVYEYCIELLKNAKTRASITAIIPPSLVGEASPLENRITINPNKMNGQPCIRDLRLTVWRVLELLQTYADRSELYREFPELTEEDIKQAIIYADTHSKDLVVVQSIAHETLA